MSQTNLSYTTMNNSVIDSTKSIMAILWKFLDKNKNGYVSANVSKMNDEVVISIIDRKKIKRFKSTNTELLLKNLGSYLRVN